MDKLESAVVDHFVFYARLGMAYNALSRWEWDDLLGEKPEGFDELPKFSKPNIFGRRKRCKYDYISPAVQLLHEVCPMLDYWAGKSDPETAAQSPIQWFARHAPDRLVSLLAKDGVIT